MFWITDLFFPVEHLVPLRVTVLCHSESRSCSSSPVAIKLHLNTVRAAPSPHPPPPTTTFITFPSILLLEKKSIHIRLVSCN